MTHGRSRFPMLLVVATLCAALCGSAWAYTIVLKDGTRFEVRGPAEYKDGKAIVMTLTGFRAFVWEKNVDKEATAKANEGKNELSWKFIDKGWKKDEKYEVDPEIDWPALGKFAPGGKTKPAYNATDLPNTELDPNATRAEAVQYIEKNLDDAVKLQGNLKKKLGDLDTDIETLKTELTKLKGMEAQAMAKGSGSVGPPKLETIPEPPETPHVYTESDIKN
ncbi:MAG: hypothetical protein U0166_08590 [Acidobacteriota bacterium]